MRGLTLRQVEVIRAVMMTGSIDGAADYLKVSGPERFFFEIVQRDRYGGYGAPNAPIRLAAQARLARGAAMPRV